MAGTEWPPELWQAAPTPQKARRLREPTIVGILKRGPIRRLDSAFVVSALHRRPLQVAAGTVEAASAHVASLVPRIRLLNRQIKDASRQIEALTARELTPEQFTAIDVAE
jgi:hypothetical protein